MPGLAAKPIIDIVLTVADSADEDAYVPALEAAGYELTIRERDWHEHRLLKGADPEVNLHVFSDRCPEIARMTAFRDHLRANPADRDLYERTKRDLARRTWTIHPGLRGREERGRRGDPGPRDSLSSRRAGPPLGGPLSTWTHLRSDCGESTLAAMPSGE